MVEELVEVQLSQSRKILLHPSCDTVFLTTFKIFFCQTSLSFLSMISARDSEKLMTRVTMYMMKLLARELEKLRTRVLAR